MTEVIDQTTPEALGLRPVRSGSMNSNNTPPTPPPEFNPPAESSPTSFDSISPPTIGNEPFPLTSNTAGDLATSASLASDTLSNIPTSAVPRRPDLRAVQRVSDDVILSSPGPTSSQSSAGGSPIGSDGGDHLQEMRERLLSEASSGESSRQPSDIATPNKSPVLDLHVTAPSPVSAEQSRPSPDAAPSRSRVGASPTQSPDTPTEHMWDSVWPASGVPPRSLAIDTIPPFQPAPVSPFVTPTFSAPAPLISRRPASPSHTPTSPSMRSSSPARSSPRHSFSEAGPSTFAKQPSAPSPSPSKHSRTLSSGSTFSRPPDIKRLETPKSPRTSLDAKAHSRSRTNESISRRAEAHSPPQLPRTVSSGSGSRPRRTSFNDVQPLRLDNESARPSIRPPVPEEDIPPLPTLSTSSGLPPALAPPPVTLAGDDGMVDTAMFAPKTATPVPPPNPRPTALRRALSDYAPRQATPPLQIHRAVSISNELDKSPSSIAADKANEHDSKEADDTETDMDSGPGVEPPSAEPVASADTPIVTSQEVGDLSLVDEGDVLPTGDYQMDITFDDEGLNALERIFLLSQSDFGFHRAYVARVLGDLLEDVDPCESVEYVLPLLNGYSVDEDDTVKEAFSSQLHKILWYFFSICRLVNEPGETVTVTSEGMSSVSRPDAEEEPPVTVAVDGRRASLMSNTSGGISSSGSSLTNPPSSVFDASHTDGDTPGSVTSAGTDLTAFSPLPWVDVSSSSDHGKESAQLAPQPELAINTFTPLLGNLMLSVNPTVGENSRDAIIAVIGRLRGVVNPDKWARIDGDPDHRKTYVSQSGLHAHDLRPFDKESKSLIEAELLSGIVLGMGRLSTELPEGCDDDDCGASKSELEAYQTQLVQEAEAGRAISMYLIGSLCDIYTGIEASERGFVEEVLGAVDGDATTRTEAAVALSRMAKIVPEEHVPHMLPVFEAFASDESELVRQAVAVALPALVKRIKSHEDRRAFAVNGIKSLYRAGDGCRIASMEIMGELIHAFHDDPLGPPDDLVEIYRDDSDGKEVWAGDCDWDIIAAFNFPGVCLTLGADRWPEIRGLFQRLQDRAGDRVLITIASSLHELAKILTPAQVAEDLLPVYTRLIDSTDTIRERIFEHVDDFVAGLPDELAWMTFLGLEKAWELGTIGGWRTREAVALHVPSFLALFVKRGHDISPILKLTMSALLDKFAAVRDAVIQAVPKSYETLAGTDFDGPFRDMLLELSKAPSYRQRVTFTRCLREFIKPPPNRQAFEDFFAPALPVLRKDVVDVRITLAQIVANLFVVGAYYSDAVTIPPVILQLAEGLAHDEAADVRDIVRHVDLDRLSKGKHLIPHEINRPDQPDRSKGPGETSGKATENMRPELKHKARSSDHQQPRFAPHDSNPNSHSDPDITPRPETHDSTFQKQRNPFANSFKHAMDSPDS